jgi:hypothetical protein
MRVRSWGLAQKRGFTGREIIAGEVSNSDIVICAIDILLNTCSYLQIKESSMLVYRQP